MIKFSRKRASIGSWLTIGDETTAEILSTSGFEWIVIDMEHSSLSMGDVGRLVRVVDAGSAVPFVRVPGLQPELVKRVLDAGALGVVFPDIRSAREADIAVKSTRYQPAGVRGVGLARAQKYGRGFNEYFRDLAPNLTVIVQVESAEALAELPKILSVEGVDAVMVGPYDLSCSLGIPGEFDSPVYKAALESILTLTVESNVPVGIHVVEPDPAAVRARVEEGFSVIAYSVDIRMLAHTADIGARECRRAK